MLLLAPIDAAQAQLAELQLRGLSVVGAAHVGQLAAGAGQARGGVRHLLLRGHQLVAQSASQVKE